jgi:gamma-glutamyltranspeptidase/glutathione hydrolase
VRDFQHLNRSAAYSDRGMVATSHPLASKAALAVLAEGGKAADAAIVAAAVLYMAEPQMTGIGGDCFWIHARADGAISAYNGSGRAPAGAQRRFFAEHDITTLEPWSAHAVTVPGAVDGWSALLEQHGSMGLDRLLAPAIALAEEGCLVHPRVAMDWAFSSCGSRVWRRPAGFIFRAAHRPARAIAIATAPSPRHCG